jgi:hypothetical protein
VTHPWPPRLGLDRRPDPPHLLPPRGRAWAGTDTFKEHRSPSLSRFPRASFLSPSVRTAPPPLPYRLSAPAPRARRRRRRNWSHHHCQLPLFGELPPRRPFLDSQGASPSLSPLRAAGAHQSIVDRRSAPLVASFG